MVISSTPICFIFLGLMVQSRVFCKQSTDALDIAVDELDISRRREALAILGKVQNIDLSHQNMCIVRPFLMRSFNLRAFCSLCKLDLSHNQLYRLPIAISSLLSLTHLFLNDNHLSSLQPKIFRQLVKLQELDLRNNELNDFSLDITELRCLRMLSVQGNPLKDDEKRKLTKLAHSERWIDIAGECKIL